MSIALSVVIHPSKTLHLLAIFFSFLLAFIGIYMAWPGTLTIFWRTVFALICLITSLSNFHHSRRLSRKKWRIAINQQGEFRCQILTLSNKSKDLQSCPPYFLTSGTTLWSGVLFLRLRRAQANTAINLLIFSDALNKDEFRRMSIACRWIVKHAK